jgi:protein-disulfide isomerase
MTSGKASRETREAKAAERRAAAQRAESRRKNSIRIAIAVAIVLVVVGFGALIQSQRGSTSDSSAAPANTSGTQNQTIAVVGQASAPVTVVAYEDFQCPICKEFEDASGPTLQQYVDAGKVKVEYRPIAILDRASSTNYSTRSMNSAGCVVATTPTAFKKFHDLLFANQPAENSAGLPDSKLADLAKQAGAGDVSKCIDDQTYKGWTVRATDQASKDGVVGTPTVKVNGTEVQQPWVVDNLKKALDAAVGG